MATNVYNFTNQRLDADRVREVQRFNSDDFAGVIAASSPFEILSTEVSLPASEENPVLFLGGGLLLSQTEPVSTSLISGNQMWYLEVHLDKESGSLSSDVLINSSGVEQVTFNNVVCEYFEITKKYTTYSIIKEAEGNPKLNEYYEYDDNGTYSLTNDTEVDSSKTYYFKIEASRFTFRSSSIGTATFNYLGNTLWTSNNSFIIPLCIYTKGEIVQLVSVRNVGDLEGLLSTDAYARIKKYCDTTFVWSSGGQAEVTDINGNTHKKGDVGSLNITDNTIDSNSRKSVMVSDLAIKDIQSSSQGEFNTRYNTNNSVISEFSDASYTDKLVLDSTGSVSRIKDYKVPVSNGGTYLSSNWDKNNPRKSAKKNLGIFYGTNDPKNSSTIGYKEGDIYFWIIE